MLVFEFLKAKLRNQRRNFELSIFISKVTANLFESVLKLHGISLRLSRPEAGYLACTLFIGADFNNVTQDVKIVSFLASRGRVT